MGVPVPYGLTVQALKDFLPVDARLNDQTVRNHTLAVAQRSPQFFVLSTTTASVVLPLRDPTGLSS